jgi:hypothetical protein
MLKSCLNLAQDVGKLEITLGKLMNKLADVIILPNNRSEISDLFSFESKILQN